MTSVQQDRRFGWLFDPLRDRAVYEIGMCGPTPSVLHDEHRWTLPLLWLARQNGALPEQALLVLFDSHHDAVSPRGWREALIDFASEAQTFDAVCELADGLSPLNDDWICAAMELGLVGHVVAFGVEDTSRAPACYVDARQEEHRLHYVSHPVGALGYQGALSDVARRVELETVWDLLDWRQQGGGSAFSFAGRQPPLMLSFDLDCFRVSWNSYQWPWPVRVFKDRYLQQSTYWSTAGWTGQRFVQGLLERAAILDIAREPSHCGGLRSSNVILRRVQRFVLGTRIEAAGATVK